MFEHFFKVMLYSLMLNYLAKEESLERTDDDDDDVEGLLVYLKSCSTKLISTKRMAICGKNTLNWHLLDVMTLLEVWIFCLFLNCMFVSQLYVCFPIVCLFPNCMFVSQLYVCFPIVCLFPNCMFVSQLYVCFPIVCLFPNCMFVSQLYVCFSIV